MRVRMRKGNGKSVNTWTVKEDTLALGLYYSGYSDREVSEALSELGYARTQQSITSRRGRKYTEGTEYELSEVDDVAIGQIAKTCEVEKEEAMKQAKEVLKQANKLGYEVCFDLGE